MLRQPGMGECPLPGSSGLQGRDRFSSDVSSLAHAVPAQGSSAWLSQPGSRLLSPSPGCPSGSGDLGLLWAAMGKVAPRPNRSQRLQDSAFPKQSGEAGQDDTTVLMYWEGEQETEALNPYKRVLWGGPG